MQRRPHLLELALIDNYKLGKQVMRYKDLTAEQISGQNDRSDIEMPRCGEKLIHYMLANVLELIKQCHCFYLRLSRRCIYLALGYGYRAPPKRCETGSRWDRTTTPEVSR